MNSSEAYRILKSLASRKFSEVRLRLGLLSGKDCLDWLNMTRQNPGEIKNKGILFLLNKQKQDNFGFVEAIELISDGLATLSPHQPQTLWETILETVWGEKNGAFFSLFSDKDLESWKESQNKFSFNLGDILYRYLVESQNPFELSFIISHTLFPYEDFIKTKDYSIRLLDLANKNPTLSFQDESTKHDIPYDLAISGDGLTLPDLLKIYFRIALLDKNAYDIKKEFVSSLNRIQRELNSFSPTLKASVREIRSLRDDFHLWAIEWLFNQNKLITDDDFSFLIDKATSSQTEIAESAWGMIAALLKNASLTRAQFSKLFRNKKASELVTPEFFFSRETLPLWSSLDEDALLVWVDKNKTALTPEQKKKLLNLFHLLPMTSPDLLWFALSWSTCVYPSLSEFVCWAEKALSIQPTDAPNSNISNFYRAMKPHQANIWDIALRADSPEHFFILALWFVVSTDRTASRSDKKKWQEIQSNQPQQAEPFLFYLQSRLQIEGQDGVNAQGAQKKEVGKDDEKQNGAAQPGLEDNPDLKPQKSFREKIKTWFEQLLKPASHPPVELESIESRSYQRGKIVQNFLKGIIILLLLWLVIQNGPFLWTRLVSFSTPAPAASITPSPVAATPTTLPDTPTVTPELPTFTPTVPPPPFTIVNAQNEPLGVELLLFDRLIPNGTGIFCYKELSACKNIFGSQADFLDTVKDKNHHFTQFTKCSNLSLENPILIADNETTRFLVRYQCDGKYAVGDIEIGNPIESTKFTQFSNPTQEIEIESLQGVSYEQNIPAFAYTNNSLDTFVANNILLAKKISVDSQNNKIILSESQASTIREDGIIASYGWFDKTLFLSFYKDGTTTLYSSMPFIRHNQWAQSEKDLRIEDKLHVPGKVVLLSFSPQGKLALLTEVDGQGLGELKVYDENFQPIAGKSVTDVFRQIYSLAWTDLGDKLLLSGTLNENLQSDKVDCEKGCLFSINIDALASPSTTPLKLFDIPGGLRYFSVGKAPAILR